MERELIHITAIYPNTAGSRFIAAYYAGEHKVLAERLLRPHGLTGLQIRLGVSALDGSPPPYWAIGEMTFPSVDAFVAAMEHCGAELVADSENYTDVTPILQISRAADSSI